MIRRYQVFADYHQFYLWDHEHQLDQELDFTQADVDNRIKAAPHLVVIQPERNMTVPVELEIATGAPEPALDGWDHVAEASLDLPSGQLEVHECTTGSVDILPVEPGTYRVRGYFGGLGTLSLDGLEGDDHYRIVVWPAPTGEVVVLKQYAGRGDER